MIDWIEHLLRDAHIVELRHQNGDRWTSGLFNDSATLRSAVRSRAGEGNLFTTVNRVGEGVEATNCMGSRALRDRDIASHARLLFDFDPRRPHGMASTDAELAAAAAASNRMMSALAGLGWPAPVVACSGNGAHLAYRVLLPASSDIRDMLTTLYRGLAQDFSTAAVDFDVTVRNPSRIWRLYGSQNRKGHACTERPHRLAVATLPHRWELVTQRKIELLAAHYARTQAGQVNAAGARREFFRGLGDYRTLDAVAWFLTHSAYRRPLGGGKHAVVCPWLSEHSTTSSGLDTSTVIWEGGSNWPTFHCSHAHCQGRAIRDVLALWGDADQFCAQAWAGGSRRAVA